MDASKAEELERAVRRLAEVDARLDEARVERHTLAPSQERATPLHEIVSALQPRLGALPPGTASSLARGLEATASAILEHFPGNLLWDFDALAAGLLREADGADALDAAFAEVVALYALYGRATPIRFSYVHDFTNGFDWAKWVRRHPEERRDVGPFDRRFLSALIDRGHELLELIEADDAKYSRLPDDQMRCPFDFSRAPVDELALHRALAVEGLLPVEAWRIEPEPRWDRPFADLRAARGVPA